jgi:hypothetical protein
VLGSIYLPACDARETIGRASRGSYLADTSLITG